LGIEGFNSLYVKNYSLHFNRQFHDNRPHPSRPLDTRGRWSKENNMKKTIIILTSYFSINPWLHPKGYRQPWPNRKILLLLLSIFSVFTCIDLTITEEKICENYPEVCENGRLVETPVLNDLSLGTINSVSIHLLKPTFTTQGNPSPKVEAYIGLENSISQTASDGGHQLRQVGSFGKRSQHRNHGNLYRADKRRTRSAGRHRRSQRFICNRHGQGL